MYLAEYEDPQMHGLFSSLKKVVKKVVKPVAHIGAAVLTGGASIPISANILAQAKARKAAQDQAARDAAEFDRQAAVLKSLQTPVATPAPALAPLPLPAPSQAVAPAAAPVSPVTTTAPTANAVQAAVSQAQPAMPTFITIPSAAPSPSYDMTFDERRTMQPVKASSGMPSWAVPAGIGAAVLIGLVAMGGRGRR